MRGAGRIVHLTPRSRFLAGLRPPAAPGRRRRMLWRWLAVAAGAGLCVWLAFGLAARRFDPDGPARILYLAHDHVYLPLKGHLWTAPYPYGVVWLGAAAVLGAAALAGLLVGRPLLQPVQRALTGVLLERPAAARALLVWHRWTKGSRVHPGHLEAVLEHRSRSALAALADLPEPAAGTGGARRAARRAVALALRRARALRHPPCTDAERLAALTVLVEARAALALVPEAGLPPPALLDETARAARAVLGTDSAGTAPGPAAVGAVEPPFAARRLAAEALLLAGRGGPDAAALHRAAAGAAARLGALDALRAALEAALAARPGRVSRAARHGCPDDPAAGRLALWLALVTAHESGVGGLAAAHVEALAGVAFAAAAAADCPDAGPDDLAAARALTDRPPDPLVHRLCAALAAGPPRALPGLAGALLAAAEWPLVAGRTAADARLAAGLDAAEPEGLA